MHGDYKAKEFGTDAGILAGGDGSRKVWNRGTIAAQGWGVYGIGEHFVEYWENLDNGKVQSMTSGGNLDWAPEGSIQHQSGANAHGVLHQCSRPNTTR
jgi:hypothetical protein